MNVARWLLMLVLVAALVLGARAVSAQAPPSQIEIALQDLSQRVGRTVALNDLTGWQWSQTLYPNTSLGCPQPDQVYSQVITSGYQFLLVYQGQTYDYRVSEDGNIIILCTSVATGTPIPTVPTPTAPAPVEPPAEPPLAACPEGLELRLTSGELARVTVGLPSNIRAGADINASEVGQLQPGETFTVIGGPTCGPDGLYWWQIQAGDLTGWIAQGEQGLYYIEPIPQPLPARAGLAQLIAENITRLVQVSRIESNLQGAVAWSPDGATLAVGNSNTVLGGVWLYDVAQLQNPPRLLETGTVVTAVTYTPDGALLIVGNDQGAIEFWDLATETQVFSIDAHDVAIQALSLSPDGLILAAVGADNRVTLWAIPEVTAG